MTAPVVQRSAYISRDGTYRWRLGRRWSDGGAVCWIMLNPSTADAERDDPTIRECVRRSREWGYGSLYAVNLYPFRSSSPAACREWADWERTSDWYARAAMHRNATIVGDVARLAELVIGAWGGATWAQGWADYLVDEHVTSGEIPCPSVYCLGLTANGQPKHPLARGRHRIPREQAPVLYREGVPE